MKLFPPWRRAASMAAAATMLAAGPVHAAAFPPLNDPSTGESHPGKFVWAELFTADAPAAARFYSGVFDWRAVTLEQKGVAYTVLYQGSHPVAGLRQRSPGAAPRAARWVGYIAVADIASTLTKVADAGGEVRAPARRFPHLGLQAIITDNTGSPVGLLQSNSGDSPDDEPGLGEWNWFHLVANDAQAASGFYRTVFLYDAAADSRAGRNGDFILSSGGINRAGISLLPPGADAKPGWLGIVRVANLDATLGRVPPLGGEIVVAPHGAAWGSRFAEIADPTGGVIGLIEYVNHSDPASQP